jgi:hypothetical protein
LEKLDESNIKQFGKKWKNDVTQKAFVRLRGNLKIFRTRRVRAGKMPALPGKALQVSSAGVSNTARSCGQECPRSQGRASGNDTELKAPSSLGAFLV